MAAESEIDTLDDILSIAQLCAFQSRVERDDERGELFDEHFEILRSSGYLIQAVPEEFGGLGLSLAEVCQQQRRLAYYAPADALAANTPVCWTGVAADLWRSDDSSLEWLLREACAGETVTAGPGETGDETALSPSTYNAERVDGGYCFTGRKNFGALSAVWTRLGLHGIDDSDPNQPKAIHAFMSRDTQGCEVRERPGVMDKRATRSHDILLDAAFVPDKYIARVTEVGIQVADPFVLGVSVWGALGCGNVYFGLARYAFDKTLALVVEQASGAKSHSMTWHPEVRGAVADMAAELDAIEAHLDSTAIDWSGGVNHGARWGAKALMTRYHAIEGAWRVIDRAFELAGGFGIDHASGWERILRDGRTGRIHPEIRALTTDVIARTYLGPNLGIQHRWR